MDEKTKKTDGRKPPAVDESKLAEALGHAFAVSEHMYDAMPDKFKPGEGVVHDYPYDWDDDPFKVPHYAAEKPDQAGKPADDQGDEPADDQGAKS